MGVFPHTWQPLSSMDPLIERHRSSHRSSPRHAENSLLTPSAHSKSEVSIITACLEFAPSVPI